MGNSEQGADVLKRLTMVFRDVFDKDDLNISDKTSASDIPEWDSLMHITLCMAVEKEFATRLSSTEIASLTNVGDLVSVLSRCVD